MAHAVLAFTFWYAETGQTSTGRERTFLFVIEGESTRHIIKKLWEMCFM